MSDDAKWVPPRTYLGDAVYAELDEWGCIILTTENGLSVTNRIVLEPHVMDALVRWAADPKPW